MKEKRLMFYQTINGLDDAAHLKYSLKYQLAPVIMGYKPSMTIGFAKLQKRKQWALYGESIMKELGLKCIVLRQSEEHFIVLIYRDCSIESILGEKENRVFLEALDYDTSSVEKALEGLKKRYEVDHCPHELGVFLGIALCDVKTYIRESDTRCLLCGYWKVYHNVDEARVIFDNYDKAKCQMLNYILEELKEVA